MASHTVSTIIVVSIACLFVGILWHRVNKKFLDDFFSPFNLLLYCWVLPFLSSYMMLSDLQDGLTLETTLIIIISTIILVSISMIPMYLLNGAPIIMRYSRKNMLRFHKGAWFIILFYIFVIAVLYLIEFRSEQLVLLRYLEKNASDPNLHRIGKDSKLQVIAFGISIAGLMCLSLGVN